MFKISRHNPEYRNINKLYQFKIDPKVPTPFQKKVVVKGHDSRWLIASGPCGSGKTMTQQFLATKDVVSSSYRQKQLIIVPQRHIGLGFVQRQGKGFSNLKLGRTVYEWNVLPETNFCLGEADNTSRLKKWLLAPASILSKGYIGTNRIGGIVAVCCYQSLIAVWSKLSKEEKRTAIRNLSLRVDESHHVNAVHLDGELDAEDAANYATQRNRLSKICQYVLNSRIQSSKIHFTTATFFRGDQIPILSMQSMNKFKFFSLPWLDHFNSLGIKSYEFETHEYTGICPIAAIVKNILAEPNESHLVKIPSLGQKWRKPNSLSKLLKTLNRESKKAGVQLNVMELVTTETQKQNKVLLAKEPEASDENKSEIDVVIACNLFNEGTNWCPCSRLHDAAPGQSITQAVQLQGRLLRRYKGKQTIKSYSYIPKFVISADSEKTRQMVSDRLTALLVSMLVDELFSPIFIDLPKMPKKKARVSLGETLGNQFGATFKELVTEFEKLSDEEKNDEAIVRDLCKRVALLHGVSHRNADAVAEGLIVKLLRSTSPKLMRINFSVEEFRKRGFDLVRRRNDSILWADCSLKQLTRLKTMLRTQEDKWKEIFNSLKDMKSIDEVIEKFGRDSTQYKWLLSQRFEYKREMAA